MIFSILLSTSLLSSTVFGVAINSELATRDTALLQRPCVWPPSESALKAQNAPDISGLEPECAKSIWCKLNGLRPVVDYVPGKYMISLKRDVTRGDVESMLNNRLFSGSSKPRALSEAAWNDKRLPNFLVGEWSYAQVCYLEKRPEVAYVEINGMAHTMGIGAV